MALTRKLLSAMGIEGDKIEEIINAHAETVNALKQERDDAKEQVEKYKADAEKLPTVQKELEKLQKAQGKDDPFEAKYNDLKAEYDKYKADVETEKTTAKKQSAYRNLLKEAGVSDKRLESVMKVSGAAIDGLKFGEDGKITDADKLTETIKNEWADFITTEGTKGADTPTPPANNGGTLKQPSRAAQLAAQYHNNLYGENKKEG